MQHISIIANIRILLDTNILIHREAATIARDDIGRLFHWLDKLRYDKCVHPLSAEEIKKHSDPNVVRTFLIKLTSYNVLKSTAPDDTDISAIRMTDKTQNDSIDTSLVAELKAGRVDFLITEDRGIHRKAALLKIASSTFTIDSFLEKVSIENPELADYRVLSVRRTTFGNLNLADSFFDSFRSDYPGFDRWFSHKSDEPAYVCTTESGSIIAFLYIKREEPEENYADISPSFSKKRRLKIGTFKVISNGYKLGERFLKIIFDNALAQQVEEIYVTIFRNTSEQERLYNLLEDWGFIHHGSKTSSAGSEAVLVRSVTPHINSTDPRRSYPFIDATTKKYIVPIYPAYHTELLPDSILNTESSADFVENRPKSLLKNPVFIHSRGVHAG